MIPFSFFLLFTPVAVATLQYYVYLRDAERNPEFQLKNVIQLFITNDLIPF